MQHNKHSIRQGKKDAMDLAAANYLEFLKKGRKAILEDAAILQDKYPKHRIFNLPCFKLPQNYSARTALQKKWAEYKAEVIAAHARSVDENIEVSLYGCNCLLHTCLFLSKLPCLSACTMSSCNILSIHEPGPVVHHRCVFKIKCY